MTISRPIPSSLSTPSRRRGIGKLLACHLAVAGALATMSGAGHAATTCGPNVTTNCETEGGSNSDVGVYQIWNLTSNSFGNGSTATSGTIVYNSGTSAAPQGLYLWDGAAKKWLQVSYTPTSIPSAPLKVAGNEGTGTVPADGTLTIKGTAARPGNYSGDNLKTVANADGTVNIQMTDQPKFGNVVINEGGTGTITGVTAGTATTDAVNFGQLDILAKKTLTFAGDSGTPVARTLDQTLNVTGGVTDPLKLTDGNIGVVADGTDKLSIKLAKNISVDSVNAGGTLLDSSGVTLTNGTALTTGGLNIAPKNTINMGGNTITNVAAGEDPMDAVNKSQLDAVSAGGYKPWKLTTSASGTGTVAGNVVAPVGSDATVTVDAGDNIAITQDATDPKKITVATKKDVAFDTVAVGSATLNTNGLFITNGPSVTTSGINAGNMQIKGVANGTSDDAAVNLSQLNGAIAGTGWNLGVNNTQTPTKVAPGATVQVNAGQNIAVTQSGTNLTIATTPNLTADSLTTGNTMVNTNGVTISGGPNQTVSLTNAGLNNGGNVITGVANGELSASSTQAINGSQLYAVSQTASAGWNLGVNGGPTTNVGPGGTVQLNAGTNMVVTQSGTNLTVATKPNLTADSVSINNGGPVVNQQGITMQAGNTLDMGGNAITNVADGVNPTDAVNVRQLQGVVQYDSKPDGSVNAQSVTLNADGGPAQMHNVAAGTAGTDAVNVNQLNAVNTGLNARMSALDDKVNRQGRALSGGIAASAAMAVVTPVEPGRFHVTGAVAGYNGQVGVGFNVIKRSADGNTSLHAGVGWGSGGSKAIVRVGFGFSFD